MRSFIRAASGALLLAATLAFHTASAAPEQRFSFDDNRMFVPVLINGAGPYMFLLDTGATNWLVDAGVANALKLQLQGSSSDDTGVGSQHVIIRHALVSTLSFGGQRWKRVSVLVADLGVIRRGLGLRRFDGIIGSAALRGRMLFIDNDDDTFSVGSLQAHHPAQAHIVPFTDADGLIRVPALIEGNASVVVVDTGDRWFFSMFKPYARSHGYERAERSGGQLTGYGLGGPTYSQIFRLRELTLFGYRLTALLTRASLDRAGIFATAAEAGSIGGGTLRQFNEIYDYPGHRLIVWPSRYFGSRTRRPESTPCI